MNDIKVENTFVSKMYKVAEHSACTLSSFIRSKPLLYFGPKHLGSILLGDIDTYLAKTVTFSYVIEKRKAIFMYLFLLLMMKPMISLLIWSWF